MSLRRSWFLHEVRLLIMPKTRPPVDRVMDRVEVDYFGCWLYTGPLDRDGYGMTSVPSSTAKRGWGTRRVHRVLYDYFREIVPDDMTLDHACRVRSCVNPDHLQICTSGENVMRGNSLQAQYAARTHCKNGHVFDGDNLFKRASGQGRGCRACQKAGEKRYRVKKEATNNG